MKYYIFYISRGGALGGGRGGNVIGRVCLACRPFINWLGITSGKMRIYITSASEHKAEDIKIDINT